MFEMIKVTLMVYVFGLTNIVNRGFKKRAVTTLFYKSPERVDELKISRNVSDLQLFNSANDFFTDIALIWYRGNKKKAQDWKSLCRLLRKEFQPKNYSQKLFKQIKERTQHPDAASYYTDKLAPKFIGPFFIHQRLNPWFNELKDKDGVLNGTWSVKDLKPFPN
ncbi:hypothetical protein FQA39_LY11876 [Lamprigera yunnana]|nr:hypothetical protein FQA39_LY11876 [Lamprigera yunnana]